METALAPKMNNKSKRLALLVSEMKRRKKFCEIKLKKLERSDLAISLKSFKPLIFPSNNHQPVLFVSLSAILLI